MPPSHDVFSCWDSLLRLSAIELVESLSIYVVSVSHRLAARHLCTSDRDNDTRMALSVVCSLTFSGLYTFS
jgi:hypothetical protein